MEGDSICGTREVRRSISIHSLRMEGDSDSHHRQDGKNTFQSTPSAWRETVSLEPHQRTAGFQSTPSAWRETRILCVNPSPVQISIHSLRMEGDWVCDNCYEEEMDFNPLPPHGGRPYTQLGTGFSTHFNPLPPHGGRPGKKRTSSAGKRFQSTPSAWRETRPWCYQRHGQPFQSTPSAWRETYNKIIFEIGGISFQSTPSAWRETAAVNNDFSAQLISIHSLRMEGDPYIWMILLQLRNFNPLPPHGGRRTAQHHR